MHATSFGVEGFYYKYFTRHVHNLMYCAHTQNMHTPILAHTHSLSLYLAMYLPLSLSYTHTHTHAHTHTHTHTQALAIALKKATEDANEVPRKKAPTS